MWRIAVRHYELLLSPEGGGFGRRLFSAGNGRAPLRVAVRRRARHHSATLSPEVFPIDAATPTIKLTDLASCGGCAAKYSAARLEELLNGFVPVDADDLLVGLAPADDAAVYRLDDERALVFTLDFFPPLVDDPADFGAIAATNALNDVFAMGGKPLLALSIAEFPEDLPLDTVGAILGAAGEQVQAAGALLAGGHTLRADEPKYGLAVVGTVRPDALWTKRDARSGDAMFLTKPLGTGLVLHGAARGLTGAEELSEAVAWMRTLNQHAAEVLRLFDPHAVTDVTGFGLLGHAHEMAQRSGVRISIDAGALPALPGALDVAGAGERTGGDRRNREFAARHVDLDGAPPKLAALAFDPQTAGGLLFALPADQGVSVEAQFAAAGLFVRRIGRVDEGAGVALEAP